MVNKEIMVNEESKDKPEIEITEDGKYILKGILQRVDVVNVVNGVRRYCMEDYLPKADVPSKPKPKKKKK